MKQNIPLIIKEVEFKKNFLDLFQIGMHSMKERMMRDMEEILAKADELGGLIRDTEIYRNFIRISNMLAVDPDATRLFQEYIRVSGSLKERQDMGDIIEKYETDELKNLLGMISENELIMRYVEAQEEYIDLLVKIQHQISDPDLDIPG